MSYSEPKLQTFPDFFVMSSSVTTFPYIAVAVFENKLENNKSVKVDLMLPFKIH